MIIRYYYLVCKLMHLLPGDHTSALERGHWRSLPLS